VSAARALVVTAVGAPPAPAEVAVPEPGPGQSLVRMRAAALNPVDLAIGAGRFYMPVPPPPYVAGAEAVGEIERSAAHPVGARVWALTRTGCFAERFVADDDALVPVPEGPDDLTAAAMGIAGLAGWMPVRERGRLAPGERVLVLGASGVVGQVAVRAAVTGGAALIVAAARDPEGLERARALGATAAVRLGGPDDAGALREACALGADLVIDPLWGEPLLAAIGALAPRARIAQVGSAAGATAALAAGPLRGGRLDIRGFSVFAEAREDVARAYAALAAAAGGGEVRVPIEAVPLAEGAAAWARQASGTRGRKLVLVP
jgi:NADPH:quinone reductase